MSKFTTVFCDLDGTFLEDSGRHYKCYEDIVKLYGGTCIPKEVYWNDKRNKVNRRVLLEKTEFLGSYEDYINYWNQHIEDEQYLQYEVIKPGAVEVLEYLQANSDELVLVTMRQSMDAVERQLTALGIRDFFKKIIKGDPTIEKKCDLIAGDYDSRTLVLGDTEADQQLAHKLGATFIAVTDGLRAAKYFADEPYQVADIRDVINLL